MLVRGNRSVGVAAGEEDPESVRICEKRDCRSFILFLAVDIWDEDDPFCPPIPRAGTETPAFERRDVAS